MRAHLLHIALAKCQQALAFGCARGVRWHSVVADAKRLTDQISYRSIAMLADLPAAKTPKTMIRMRSLLGYSRSKTQHLLAVSAYILALLSSSVDEQRNRSGKY